MQAVIIAGGKGTRIAEKFPELPKPMLPIQGKPLLEHHIRILKKQNITDIYLIIGYLGEKIKAYFQDGSKFGVRIHYFEEKEPLGTAGALPILADKLDEEFILLFGDLYSDICYSSLLEFHYEKQAIVTLIAHPNSHPFDSDLIVCDEDGRVKEWISKKEKRVNDYKNLVNSGVYLLSKSAITSIAGKKPEVECGRRLDLEKDIICSLIAEGAPVFAYRSTEYIKDMGTPKRYEVVNRDVGSEMPAFRNSSRKQKCIFLDRDGTINQLAGFLAEKEQIKLIPGTAAAIRKINQSGYLCIVITNQPVIARGECSFEKLDEIHMRLETLLGDEGAYLDDLFFCPHHPDKGFKGERSELKMACNCRKPGIQMFLDASTRYNIDLTESFMIGDSTVDIAAGHNAGIKTILLKTGVAGRDGKYNVQPDYDCDNLNEAVSYILNR